MIKRPGTPTYPKIVGPEELEPYYSHHVGAMTSEGLHHKSDIAFQLALRDKRIAELEQHNEGWRRMCIRVAEMGKVDVKFCSIGDAEAYRAGPGQPPPTDAQAIAALRRIVRRALACGQLEKLEDAKRYLDDSDTLFTHECASARNGMPCGCEGIP